MGIFLGWGWKCGERLRLVCRRVGARRKLYGFVATLSFWRAPHLEFSLDQVVGLLFGSARSPKLLDTGGPGSWPSRAPAARLVSFHCLNRLIGVRQHATIYRVKIRNFVHKGLKKLFVEDIAQGLPPDAVDKLRAILTFLQDMRDPEKLRAFPLWKVHQLTGAARASGAYTSRATGD